MKFNVSKALQKIDDGELYLRGKGLDANSLKVLVKKLPYDLKALNLSMNLIGNDGLEYLCNYLEKANVNELGLHNCGLGPHAAELFADKLQNLSLEKLNLSFNNLSSQNSSQVIAKLCAHLKELNLVGAFTDLDETMHVNLDNVHMQHLGLNGNEFSEGMKIEVTLKDSYLEELDLSGNFPGKGHLKFDTTNTTIKHLNLADNHLSEAIINGLAEQLVPLNISHLSLKGNHLSLEAVEALAIQLPKMNLDSLDLSWNKLNTEAIRLLCSYLPQTAIKSLSLADNQLCNEGENALLSFRDTHLQSLNLNSNKAGKHGGKLILDLENSALKELNLVSNAIGENGSILSLNLKNSQLEELNLTNCTMTPEVTKELVANLQGSSIKTLECVRTKMNAEAFVMLLSHLKNTAITKLIVSENRLETSAPIHIDLSDTAIEYLELDSNGIGKQSNLTFNFENSPLKVLYMGTNRLNKESIYALCQALEKSKVTTLHIASLDADIMEALGVGLQRTPVEIIKTGSWELKPQEIRALLENLKGSKLTELDLYLHHVSVPTLQALTANLGNIKTLRLNAPYLREDDLHALFTGLRNTKVATLDLLGVTIAEINEKDLAKYVANSPITDLAGIEGNSKLILKALDKNEERRSQPQSVTQKSSCFGKLFSCASKKVTDPETSEHTHAAVPK